MCPESEMLFCNESAWSLMILTQKPMPSSVFLIFTTFLKIEIQHKNVIHRESREFINAFHIFILVLVMNNQ
jgi:hypothetical protein